MAHKEGKVHKLKGITRRKTRENSSEEVFLVRVWSRVATDGLIQETTRTAKLTGGDVKEERQGKIIPDIVPLTAALGEVSICPLTRKLSGGDRRGKLHKRNSAEKAKKWLRSKKLKICL